MWPDRRICELLNIEHPIIQAPMAGSATPELAIAVSNMGALGSIGCGEMTLQEVQTVANTLRAGTNRSFNLNFFIETPSKTDADVLERTRERLRPWYQKFGLGEPPGKLPEIAPTFDDACVSMLLEIKPPVVSFHFGVPKSDVILALKNAGILLISSATTVAEARLVAASGMDAVIAQGWEAGGHRGSHQPSDPQQGVGTIALVPQIADAVSIPVIAAGGIGDGRGIAAAFALGGSGVQIGTGFLSCSEAGTDEPRRKLLRNAQDIDTIVTDAISGRSARTRRSTFVDEMEKSREKVPAFRQMYGLSEPLMNVATDQEASFHLYGQAAALSREMDAAGLVQCLLDETAEIFASMAKV